MDKELKELLKKLKQLDKNLDKLMNLDIQGAVEKGFEEPAELSIKKCEDGKATIKVEGTNMAVLVALAGLEKAVFKQLDVPTPLWELVKKAVGTEVAE